MPSVTVTSCQIRQLGFYTVMTFQALIGLIWEHLKWATQEYKGSGGKESTCGHGSEEYMWVNHLRDKSVNTLSLEMLPSSIGGDGVCGTTGCQPCCDQVSRVCSSEQLSLPLDWKMETRNPICLMGLLLAIGKGS